MAKDESKQSADRRARAARGRIDADIQSKRPIKNADIRELGEASKASGKAQKKLEIQQAKDKAERDAKKKGKGRK